MSKTVLVFVGSLLLSFAAFSQSSTDDNLAYQYFQQGNYDKAAEIFGKLYRQTNSLGYFEIYHSSLLKSKQFDLAEQLCKKLIKQSPSRFNYQIALAKTYQEEGKTKEAQKIFEYTIENYTKDEPSTRELANLLYGMDAYDWSIKTFLQGRKFLKDDNAFGFELISLYRLRKDKQALVDEYLNLLPQNPLWLNQAQSVLANLLENAADYLYLQSALLKKVQRNPDSEVLNSLLIWQFTQQKEYEQALRQLIAQDKRKKTPSSDIIQYASIFEQNQAYVTAIKAYEYLVAKGPDFDAYVYAKVQLINCKFELALVNKVELPALQLLADDFASLIQQYGINGQTLFAVKKLAYLKAYLLKQTNEAEEVLEKALSVPNLPAQEVANLKISLGDIYVLNKQPWEAILVYEQVAKQFENSTVGSEARFRSAQLSFFQGNFAYAKSQADVLKAASSQLIANDALKLSLLISDNLTNKNDSSALVFFAQAAMLQKFLNWEAALSKLDSVKTLYPNNSLADDIAMAKAKIFMGQMKFQQAADQFKQLLEMHSHSFWADEAIFTLADLLDKRLNNREESEKYFKLLLTDYPASLFIDEARKRYRLMRGDNLGL
jgi:tetratricopeptide (TPR) repeat protein